jgi:hypothetical protein
VLNGEHQKKLIEVALPLEAINKEAAREKSIRHGLEDPRDAPKVGGVAVDDLDGEFARAGRNKGWQQPNDEIAA